MRVLIIDGDQAVRSMACYMLSVDGFDVKEAPDMRQLREILAQGFIPDVIVACRFNDSDGGFYLRSVRSHPDLQYVPVLLIAEKGELDRQMQWKEAGVTCWITRPFTPEEFLGIVRMMMFERAID